MTPTGTLLLTRDHLSRLLSVSDYLEIVETAFCAHAQGRALESGLMHVNAEAGEFHIKAGGLQLERPYFAVKINGGFFGNGAKYGMPPIQGVILLCDAESGYPLALMDSTAITLGRTGAITAVAARHLARSDSHVVTICGCGNQGEVQLRYITQVLPIAAAYAWDLDAKRAQCFASKLSEELGIAVTVAADLERAVQSSDVCITCTSSRTPYLRAQYIPVGMFVAAVGADSPEKQELHPDVFASATVVVDLLEQCVAVGELHHALAAGVLARDGVHGELGDILVGRKPGRTTRDEIVVFDTTGTALQDAAAAVAAYTRAVAQQEGTFFDFFSRAHA